MSGGASRRDAGRQAVRHELGDKLAGEAGRAVDDEVERLWHRGSTEVYTPVLQYT